MKEHTIYYYALLCAVLSVVAHAAAKTYRNDYVYNSRTDAFYKVHMNTPSNFGREKVCELEGAKLMPPMSMQELSQVLAVIRQSQYQDEDENRQQHDSTDGQTIIDLESEVKDVLEMSCQVTTRDGYIQSHSVVRDLPFVCKIEAKEVFYDPQCRVHARGYRFFPSVGSCYKIPNVPLAWRQAAAECRADGAHLAVINSNLEANLLKDIMKPPRYTPNAHVQGFFILGFRAVKLTEPREFKTIFNQTLEEAGYSTWIKGDPNNMNGNEQCGTVQYTGLLNDGCCDCRLAFICEKEVISCK